MTAAHDPQVGPLPIRGFVHAMIIFGTRPEAIKLSPVIREIAGSKSFVSSVVNTGQHREMLDGLMPVLEIKPDVELAVMRNGQQLAELTGRLLTALDAVVSAHRPDLVIVQGDTTTALCGAFAAAYQGVPVVHVEAGLRTTSIDEPFPEELNRRLITRMARLHFAPTEPAAANLRAEGIPRERIEVTGNTGIDSLRWMIPRARRSAAFKQPGMRKILVTLHRRETQGKPMTSLAEALRRLADRGDCELLLPLHKSPDVRDSLLCVLTDHPNITLTEPLGYDDFIATLAACDLVLTDSGGVCEEAPFFGKPVLVLRSTTERPEAVVAGVARVVGTDPEQLVEAAGTLLGDKAAYGCMAQKTSPFGDGRAASRILASLELNFCGMNTLKDLTRKAQIRVPSVSAPYHIRRSTG